MQRQKITLSDSPKEVILKMCGGNPGAIRVLTELISSGDLQVNFVDLLHIVDMGMRGPQIWVAYKDYCKQDIEKLRAAVRARDPKMIEVVNMETPDQEPCKTHGMS